MKNDNWIPKTKLSKKQMAAIERIISDCFSKVLSNSDYNDEFDYPPDTWSKQAIQLFDLADGLTNQVAGQIKDLLT